MKTLRYNIEKHQNIGQDVIKKRISHRVKGGQTMSKIEGYGISQNSFYANSAKNKGAKGTGKKDKTDKTGKKESPVQLSVRAKRLLEELKRKYGNMDFIVADYESEEEAASYLSRGTKEYSVLIEPETLEEMAADESVKEQYTGILEDAVGSLKDMEGKLGDRKEEVKHLGVSIGSDGTVSYFADLEKIGERQKEWLDKTLADKKEAKAAQEKKAQDKAASERTKTTRVQADSVEELLEKINAVDWNQVKAEDKPVAGGRFDFSI